MRVAMESNRRRAFTVLELFVVVSILGVLISLLVPAVQSAREASRRLVCANNLKQLGLALNNYLQTHQSFPMNIGADLSVASQSHVAVRPYSALTRLLPFLDQVSLFAALNYDLQSSPAFDGSVAYANSSVYSVSVSTFICPSDRSGVPTRYGTNYRGNTGIGPSPGTTAENSDSGNGFYNFPRALRPASFPDGLSHTISYSERLRGSGGSADSSFERDLGDLSPYPYSTVRDADTALSWCRVAGTKKFPFSRAAGFSWFYADAECSTYCHAQAPNGRIPDALEFSPARWGIVTARSWHFGGVNCLFGDGSTRFIADSIERRVWRGLGTRNGGELVE